MKLLLRKFLNLVKYFSITSCIIIIISIGFLSFRELFHTNKGQSVSHGTRFNGTLERGWLLPYRGENYGSFSGISYYLMDNAYVHNSVYRSVLESYQSLNSTINSECLYYYMECSDHSGGNLYLHRSHENGLSIDFMIPKQKEGKPYTYLDQWGLFHYFLETDNYGNYKQNYSLLNFLSPSVSKFIGRLFIPKNVTNDFEKLADHILALDIACNKNGISIKQVIIKIEFKEKLFSTPSGRKLLSRGVYFANKLPSEVNEMHDEHYHIDFNI
ncbi:hypothetical protein [Flammeovirga kamogawensis]|uniref:Uncharacterized protein n=1 Tax=Flammeovirga kamogawensis TaxID=373891 RepID=A0ABX8H0K5_9BACT|nr:hypothetical protein [Flammeovirga kamogawensis]MBB6462179.1 penicillin-insensitive murein endopeptidase [Flammeovirga kamogawensis]QWG09418.1 hypothetical protein KM029_22690 [Flammeovirga kamogawensis]TRX64936.1 hypothetical protein EO216_20600 [Flammeovirga kamogawensis]